MPSTRMNSNRFKDVMHLIVVCGVGTNIFIAGLLIYLSVSEILYSPILGTTIFIVSYVLMIKGKVSVKKAFIITSYTVAAEVLIHTHYLGWDAGFFYFYYATSLVFLLDYTWKLSTVILFNGSMVALTILTAYIYHGKPGAVDIAPEYINNLNLFNQIIIAVVILSITIYFSYASGKKDFALKVANRELEAQNKEISEQRNHLQVLLKEVHHRVKNNLQIISSLLSLQSRTVKDKEALKVLSKSQNRIDAIALIHQNLYGSKPGNEVDFKAYIYELVASQSVIQSKIECDIFVEASTLNLDIAVPLGLIISELMTNSVKHAFEDIEKPRITITFSKNGNAYCLLYRDNGVGLSQEFNIHSSKSLGVEIITALVDQIDAELNYKNDNGAVFQIDFTAV
jgi:two-component sensor histidine kinase